MSFLPEPPFIDISTDDLQGTNLFQFAVDLIKSFVKFMKALKEIVFDRLPDILSQAEEFPHQAEEVKEHAGPEFEALNPINKAKALGYFASNVATLSKVPAFVKGALENFKAQYEEIKEVVDWMKDNVNELKKNGENCHLAKMHLPTECYKQVHGAITYTATDRSAWETKNHGWHKGVHFEPETIPTTDMIAEVKEAKK